MWKEQFSGNRVNKIKFKKVKNDILNRYFEIIQYLCSFAR